MWQNFQNALEKKVQASNGVNQKNKKIRLDKYFIENVFNQVIEEFFGSFGKKNCFFSGQENGVVFVRIVKAVWRSEFETRKYQLITRINEKIGQKTIFKLIIKN